MCPQHRQKPINGILWAKSDGREEMEPKERESVKFKGGEKR
jgi:hypothetical protein